MGKNFRETIKEQLEDPEFRKEWEATEVEYQLIRAMLDVRERNHLTQKELAEITGITQADISRIENGNANPSLRTLKKIAKGVGMEIKLEFIPAV